MKSIDCTHLCPAKPLCLPIFIFSFSAFCVYSTTNLWEELVLWCIDLRSHVKHWIGSAADQKAPNQIQSHSMRRPNLVRSISVCIPCCQMHIHNIYMHPQQIRIVWCGKILIEMYYSHANTDVCMLYCTGAACIDAWRLSPVPATLQQIPKGYAWLVNTFCAEWIVKCTIYIHVWLCSLVQYSHWHFGMYGCNVQCICCIKDALLYPNWKNILHLDDFEKRFRSKSTHTHHIKYVYYIIMYCLYSINSHISTLTLVLPVNIKQISFGCHKQILIEWLNVYIVLVRLLIRGWLPLLLLVHKCAIVLAGTEPALQQILPSTVGNLGKQPAQLHIPSIEDQCI